MFRVVGLIVAGTVTILASYGDSVAFAASPQGNVVVPVALTEVRQQASGSLARSLWSNVFAIQDVGGALDRPGSINVVARAGFKLSGRERQALIVEFTGRGGGRCLGVSLLTLRGSPTAFDCEAVVPSIGFQKVLDPRGYVTVAALLDQDVQTMELVLDRARSVRVRSTTHTVAANLKGRNRIWFVPLRSHYPISIILRNRNGRAIDGFGLVCVERPGLCG